MSIEVMRYVWKYSKAKGNARLMLLAIADISNDNGDAYPGVDKLSTKCNMSHRSAQLVINDLERANELKVYENVGTKTISGWTNLYRVVLEGVKQGDIRKPNGEIASARVVSVKKERKLIVGVQPVTPLKDMQPVTRHDMQPDSPHEVQPVTPKSPEHSSGDTTVKSAKAPKSTSTDKKLPKRTAKFTRAYILAYNELMGTNSNLLVSAWFGGTYKSITELENWSAQNFIETNEELEVLGVGTDKYCDFVKHVKTTQHWQGRKNAVLPSEMRKCITTFKDSLSVVIPPPTNKPMTEAEYILKQIEREGESYGRAS